jgi:hypothetical protein
LFKYIYIYIFNRRFGDFKSVQTSNVSNISYGLNPPSITDEQSNSSTYGGQYVPTKTSIIALKSSTGSKGDKSYLEGKYTYMYIYVFT